MRFDSPPAKASAIANRPQRSSYDVVIVGGAMYGSSVAWFLANNADFNGSILVDPRKRYTFIFVNGFSGHGFQQSPAMDRGTSELITYGEYRSLDLSPFNFERIANNKPFVEKAVI
jgi:glycine/D-amino acid oxidase-like deaminating enzyme